ncbi:hypothetical protein [Geomicrobium sediminis]|uniref:DUF3888 domain-containing protein n=1 Tax=Geomicrobium sediminis TaxID=1347788 RepID=A0ABS2PAN2_9BACL|nr:hypothetical protein [Geomicrobium sediminis]MBM7632046.1 hypothetical protein [Geomicrobium sediminis]
MRAIGMVASLVILLSQPLIEFPDHHEFQGDEPIHQLIISLLSDEIAHVMVEEEKEYRTEDADVVDVKWHEEDAEITIKLLSNTNEQPISHVIDTLTFEISNGEVELTHHQSEAICLTPK